MAMTNKKNKNKTSTTTPDYTAQATEYYAGTKAGEIKSTNSAYDSQRDTTNASYDKQVFDTSKLYENQYRDNAVQKEINKRQVAESMANLGLRDSGLNRTQQTAVQLSYGNNKAAIDSNKQNAIDDLEFSRSQALDSIEQNRASSLSSIENNYAGYIRDRADTLRSNDESTYSQWVSTALQNGEMPSDEIINLSGMSKSVVKSLYNLYKTAGTKSDYQSLVTTSVQNGIMPSDNVISLAGMDKSEVKAMYNAYKKILNSSSTSTKSTKTPTGTKQETENAYKTRTYGGSNSEYGTNYFYDENGKKYTYPKYTNPYTGKPITGGYTTEELEEFGVWNGYQPKGVKYDGKNYGKITAYEVDGNTVKINHQGHQKTIWKTSDGSLWVWDDEVGNYVQAFDRGNGKIEYEIQE